MMNMSGLQYGTTAAIQKWGNSQGIRIPKKYLNILHIEENETVELSIINDAILIQKRKKFNNLAERLEAFYGKPIDDIYIENTNEVDWGEPEGEEIW